MKCRQAQDLMGTYLYGDLNPEEMRGLRVHAQDCALCREDLATRGRVISSLSDASPTLDDVDRQRIAWSVKGAIGRKKARRRPLVLRLAPALLLIIAVLAAGFYAGRMATHSPQQTARSHEAIERAKAKIEVKETTPDATKTGKVSDQVLDALQSIFHQANTQPGLNRESEGSRHLAGRTRTATPPDNGVKMAPEPRASSPQQPAASDNSAATPKDSGVAAKKSETGEHAGETKLPRVSDPKNAETAPSESQ